MLTEWIDERDEGTVGVWFLAVIFRVFLDTHTLSALNIFSILFELKKVNNCDDIKIKYQYLSIS